jgi:hypothetical protein
VISSCGESLYYVRVKRVKAVPTGLSVAFSLLIILAPIFTLFHKCSTNAYGHFEHPRIPDPRLRTIAKPVA